MTAPLWILTFHRTGSTYFAGLLNKLTTNGHHIFQPEIREYYNRKYKLPETPPLNCKLHHSEAKRNNLTPEMVEAHSAGVRFVILVREDPVAQAVSGYITKYTKFTNTTDEAELEAFRRTTIPLDVPTLMKFYFQNLNKSAKLWKEWLGDREPHIFTYEQVSKQPKAAIEEVLRLIGYTAPTDGEPEIAFKKLEHPCNKQLKDIIWKLIHAGKLPKPPPAQKVL